MSTQVQFRRGNTAQTSTFTGATAEITIDTTKNTVVVHDGSTVGGIPLARESALTANVASITNAFNAANAAFLQANTASTTANFAFLAANTATATDTTQNNSITAAFTAANSSGVYANSAFIHANASFAFANTISGGAAIDNVARSLANTAEQTAITAGSYANSAFLIANSTAAYSNTVNNTQNNSITAAFTAANAAQSTATQALVEISANTYLQQYINLTQNNSIEAAFTAANSAGVYANGAFTRANNSLNANTGGTIVGDVSISGNLTVSGLTTYTNTTTLLVADNIITVNAAINQSAQPTVNAGLEVDRGAQPNTSILWIETLGKWTANNGNGSITLAADSAESYANGAFVTANAAFVQANSNYISAVTRLTVTNNGSSAYLIDQYTGNNASIYVSGGETIAFHLNGITGHPFMIRVSSGGANYDTGLTHVANNGTVTTQSSAQGQVAGTLYWKVPFGIVGSTYVYQCSAHAGMVGNIVIQQPASFVAANTTLAFTTANAAFTAANSAAGDGLAFAIALG